MEYTFQILLGEGPLLHQARRWIRYQGAAVGASDEPILYIVPSGFFGKEYGTIASLPTTPLKSIDGVPLLFGSPGVERVGNCLVIRADIIASTYFMVTRYEEVVRRDLRDEHGRFPGKQSLPYRAGFIDHPIVDEYAALLRKWLREVGVNVPEPKRKFSVLLTHDVDHLRKFRRRTQVLRTAASVLLGRQSWQQIPESLRVVFGLQREPFDTFEDLIALDAGLGQAPSCPRSEAVYFLMAGGNPRFDGTYDIRSKAARETLRTVLQSGASIGLHTSYEAAGRFERIAEEKARLEEACGFPIRRNRCHYLAWREVEDGWALAKAGIRWDSTLGYPDIAGFRLGVCRPIPLFDPVRMCEMGIEEHPLIIMDGTLSDARYMGLQEDEALQRCLELMQTTRRHDGEFVVLWHNSSLGRSGSYHRRLYERLLAALAS